MMAEPTSRPLRPPTARTVVEAIVVLVVIVVLLFAADTLARSAAESLLARNVRDAVSAEADPVVTVQGRFFLPQVLRGAYSRVDVTTVGVTAGPLRIDRVESSLDDVRVPFHDVLLRDVRAAGIGRSVQTATLTYADLNAYFARTGRPLEVSAGTADRVRLAGTVEVLDQRIEVAAESRIVATDGQLSFVPEVVETSRDLGSATRLLLGQRLRLTVPLGTLPFGQQVSAVETGPDGITVTATGARIVINP